MQLFCRSELIEPRRPATKEGSEVVPCGAAARICPWVWWCGKRKNDVAASPQWCYGFAIVMYCAFGAKWNEICPHSRQRIFHICEANISQRSYFTCPQGKFRWKKHACACFFLWRVSDLDAKPCVADLDAGGFCRGQTTPLAVMSCENLSEKSISQLCW